MNNLNSNDYCSATKFDESFLENTKINLKQYYGLPTDNITCGISAKYLDLFFLEALGFGPVNDAQAFYDQCSSIDLLSSVTFYVYETFVFASDLPSLIEAAAYGYSMPDLEYKNLSTALNEYKNMYENVGLYCELSPTIVIDYLNNVLAQAEMNITIVNTISMSYDYGFITIYEFASEEQAYEFYSVYSSDPDYSYYGYQGCFFAEADDSALYDMFASASSMSDTLTEIVNNINSIGGEVLERADASLILEHNEMFEQGGYYDIVLVDMVNGDNDYYGTFAIFEFSSYWGSYYFCNNYLHNYYYTCSRISDNIVILAYNEEFIDIALGLASNESITPNEQLATYESNLLSNDLEVSYFSADEIANANVEFGEDILVNGLSATNSYGVSITIYEFVSSDVAQEALYELEGSYSYYATVGLNR